MKRHWLPLALLILAVPFLAGCPDPQAANVSEAAAVAAAGDLAADPTILPTPRPALDAAPDLSGASLVINDATLAKMAADAVPSSVTAALASLKGREFSNAAEFAEAVRGAAGADGDANMDRILRNALVMNLANQPAPPEGEVSIADREQRKAQAMAEQPMASASGYGIVFFDFDRSEIKPAYETTIRENAAKLLEMADVKITIEGHADERGTNEYNLALGQRRAEAVRQALVAAGVSAGRLSTVSYGEERPVAMGHDEGAWAQNRRGMIVEN